jgi:D-glycero-D-manno-heptose 1,7-bisphosphate phosphatase
MALIILGRDGVINQNSNGYIMSPEDWEPIDGSLEAIARLNQAGYRVVVMTNQPGITDGTLTTETLNRIHSKMRRMLSQAGGKIEAILFCPHEPNEKCSCQETENGSFSELSHRLRINLKGVPAVGDSLREIKAAQAAGANPILVKTGNGAQALTDGIDFNIPVYDDLASTVTALLEL